MTEKIYHSSDRLEMPAEVIRCTAQDDGRFEVILNATLFHPKGGGQPSDSGFIGNASVTEVTEAEGIIKHLTDQAVALGSVMLRVDGEQRLRHTRYHSAGHLIAYAGEKFGWYGYKGNHKPGEGRIVFRAGEHSVSVTEEALSVETAQLIAANLPRVLSDVAGKRQVSWGALAHYACGGTHVANTGDIGDVIITKVKEKRGELSVQYQLND